jgi:lipoprotein-anchoring transpeptidase ErfK/SrfK
MGDYTVNKIGLYVVLTTSAFLVYSSSVFSEDDFYQSNDSSYDFTENGSDQNPDESRIVVREPEETDAVVREPEETDAVVREPEEEEKDDAIPAQRQVNSSHQLNHQYIYDASDGRLPKQIPAEGEKVIIVDPKVHAWGAYSSSGMLMKQGLAAAGSKWCADLNRPCRTKSGIFRIQSLGDSDCISSRYPLGEGGAPMPYCMYFNGNQGLHGSNQVAAANISHGCVRLRVSDAQWLRYHFAQRGTKVIIKNY